MGDYPIDPDSVAKAIKRISVVIADEHPFMREGVKGFLESEADIAVVGVAANGQEALRLVERLRPDVLVTDVQLPVMGALAVLQQLGQRGLRTRVVILTSSSGRQDLLPLLEAGATGYVRKDTAADHLVETIRAVVAGRVVVTPQLVALMLRADDRPAGVESPAPPLPPLTKRQRDVLTLIAQGYSNGEIAAKLFVGVKTVETHRMNLYRKLEVHSVSELFAVASRQNLIKL